MKTIFHAMEEKILQQFIETKRELLEIASSMSAKERAEGRKEIMEAVTLFDIPEDLENPRDLYNIDGDGDAIIPIRGKLTSQVDICDGFFSDCTTYGFIQAAALAADEDPGVNRIKFHISSGGGHVTGVDATGQVIANLKKPTEGIISGMAASAAYWLASQMNKITVSAPTDFVGSIGVAIEFLDLRKREEAMGVNRIILTSTDAPDKRLDIATEEGQEKVIEELDAIHHVFASRVSVGRNVSIEKINKDFGQGGVVIASKAKKAGMIDVINNEISGSSGPAITPPAAAGKPNKEASIMNLKELLAANPDAQTEYNAAITIAADTASAEGETAGKTAGMEQMKAAFTAALPILSSDSYPDTVKERVTVKAMAGDTEGLADFVAMHDMNLENQNQNDADDDAGDDTPPEPPAGDISADGMVSNPTELAGAVAQHKAEYGTDVGGTK